MKYLGIVIAIVLLGGAVWYAFSQSSAPAPQGSEGTATTTNPSEGTTYRIDPAASSVKFSGSKPLIPNYVDTGTIGIKEGTLSVGTTSGTGSIVMDMTTVKVGTTGKGEAAAAPLTEHLKKSDFFDVTTYPTATFAVESVVARPDTSSSSMYNISGTLTMKGKSNPVSFPAKIYLEDGKLHADASLSIDRTKWGITFGSKDFVAAIGNNAISNDVKLDLAIVANPQ